MARRVLTNVLADIVDEKHIDMAVKIDAHLRDQWDRYASPEYMVLLKSFDDEKKHEGELADFTVFMLITQAMLESMEIATYKMIEEGDPQIAHSLSAAEDE